MSMSYKLQVKETLIFFFLESALTILKWLTGSMFDSNERDMGFYFGVCPDYSKKTYRFNVHLTFSERDTMGFFESALTILKRLTGKCLSCNSRKRFQSSFRIWNLFISQILVWIFFKSNMKIFAH